MCANDLKINEKGIIKEILGNNRIQRQRILDIGFIPKTEISCYIKIFSISIFKVKGGLFGLRNESSKYIILE